MTLVGDLFGKGYHLLERHVTKPGPLAGPLRMETCGSGSSVCQPAAAENITDQG